MEGLRQRRVRRDEEEVEEEEEFVTSGNWRGTHNSLSGGADADTPYDEREVHNGDGREGGDSDAGQEDSESGDEGVEEDEDEDAGEDGSEDEPPHVVGGGERERATHDVYAPSDVRALLNAFYSRVNPEKLPSVDSIVEEMESRIAERSGPGGRGREAVYSEIARLNQRLRETYGQDLSLVMPHAAQNRPPRQQSTHYHHHQQQQQPQPFSAASIILFALCLGLLAPTAYYAWELAVTGHSGAPHLQAFPPHKHSGWRHTVQDRRITLDVSLEDLYKGKSGTVSFRRQVVCHECHGSGAESSQTCRRCGGHGQSVARSPFGLVRVQCEACGGRGWVPTTRCSKCGGHGALSHSHEVSYTIPPGSVGGSTITLRGQGDEAPHANTGDIILQINERADSRFRRVGADLHVDAYITLEEALLGWSREIDLFGELIKISTADLILKPTGKGDRKERVTPMGSSLQIRGKGMSPGARRGRGYLVVHIKVQIPDLTSQQADAIKSILA